MFLRSRALPVRRADNLRNVFLHNAHIFISFGCFNLYTVLLHVLESLKYRQLFL
jgi:hypothetical protein